MKIFVNDTNILIDLADLDLLEAFSKLDALLYTTDLIVAEISDAKEKTKIQSLIDRDILKVIPLKAEEFNAVYSIKEDNSGLSFEDCSVWFLADKYQGTLVTGDGKLRKQATRKGTEVRGILYLFDEFVKNAILDHETARDRLILLREINPRLPEREINKRLRLWKKQP